MTDQQWQVKPAAIAGRALHPVMAILVDIELETKTLMGCTEVVDTANKVDALIKVLYLAIGKASQKWTMPIREWKKALNWFAQLFGDRLLDRLNTQNC